MLEEMFQTKTEVTNVETEMQEFGRTIPKCNTFEPSLTFTFILGHIYSEINAWDLQEKH